MKINQIHGKQLSYNNYNDIFSALTISKSLPKNIGTVIVKHANPCGVSINKNPLISYKNLDIEFLDSKFINQKMINQIEFRKKEFAK